VRSHGRPGRRGFRLSLLPVIFACLAGAAAAGPRSADTVRAAATPGRLPADIVYRRFVKADSAVVFSHLTHVGYAAGLCTGCHPRPFPMLKRAPEPRHREMDAGGSCGTCHDGKKAVGTRSTTGCLACHSGMGAPRVAAGAPAVGAAAHRLPRPHPFPRGGDSPGLVTFRHETHLRAGGGCVSCHPKPFPMASAPPRPNGEMHARAACGACHDGARAFSCEDGEACARCHAGTGSGR
jgi:c(7)-type cytochrome triheme protein